MDAPSMFLCLDLLPKPNLGLPREEDDTIPKLMLHAQEHPDLYDRSWVTFPTVEAATAWAEKRPTAVVMPLIIEFNPLLGY